MSMGLLSRRDPDDPNDVVVELDRWQLTGLILAVFVLSALSFAVGLAVGEDRAGQTATAPQLDLDAPAAQAPATRDRQLSLAEAAPDLGKLQLDARRVDPGEGTASTPAEVARMATHRALLQAREQGVGHLPSEAPPAHQPASGLPAEGSGEPSGSPPAAPPAPPAAPPAAHALAVATVSSEASASAMKAAIAKLAPPGIPVRVRAIADPSGARAYRVEVGRFETAREAATFQKQFQADSGYLVTVVGVP
jgi:hypothetical protein